ncbi:hypothetical protein B0H13DRAFT_2667127 [Mycena leptocephala]|nr:hypothetical protein B0H13DRAFT_2667127 [Mycena leptocephala]
MGAGSVSSASVSAIEAASKRSISARKDALSSSCASFILCVCCSLLGAPPIPSSFRIAPSFVRVPAHAPPPYIVVAPSFPGSASLRWRHNRPLLSLHPPVRAVDDDDMWASARRRAAVVLPLSPHSPIRTIPTLTNPLATPRWTRDAGRARAGGRCWRTPPPLPLPFSPSSVSLPAPTDPLRGSSASSASYGRCPILLKPPLPVRGPAVDEGRARGVHVASSLLPHSFVHPPVPILVREQLPKAAPSSSNRPCPLAAPQSTTRPARRAVSFSLVPVPILVRAAPDVCEVEEDEDDGARVEHAQEGG